METIRAAERAEAAYERKMYRYKAHYSLDCENGIEYAVLLKPQTPEMLLEEVRSQSSSSRSAVQQAIIDCSDYIKMVQKTALMVKK